MIASTTVGCLSDRSATGASWDWLTPRRFGIALALIILAVFPEVILGRETFAFRDFSIFGYPIALYHKEAFWRGEIPLWNPLNSFGLPFLAQWNTMTLYPLSLIYLLLPLPWSLNMFCLIHLFLGGMGMFYLTSRWTGSRLAGASSGVAYTFCGLLTVALIWPNILAVLCWLPWVLLAVERGLRDGGVHFWIAAFVAALQMLAGMPEYTLFTWLIATGLWLVQKPTWIACRRLLGLVLTVTGLIAVQLLPFVELFRESQRHEMFEAGSWSLPVWGWANFFVPLFHTRAVPQGVHFPAEQPLFTSYYVTLPVVAFALYAAIFVRDRRIWFLSGAAIFGFWLALGKSGYLYKWLLALSPAFGAMRYPVKFLALTIVALPILAAFGIAHWTSPATQRRHHHIFAIAALCGALVVGVLAYSHYRPVPDHDGPPVLWNGLLRLVFLAGGVALLFALKRKFESATATLWCPIALLGCLTFDSLTHAPKQNPTAPRDVYAPGAIGTRIANPPLPGQGRVLMSRGTHDFLYYNMLADPFDDLMGRRMSAFGNLNLIDNVATPDGFYAMYLPAARQIWKNLFFAPADRFPSPIADFSGITHISHPTNMLEWIARSNAMPLVSAGQQPRFRDNRTNLLGVVHQRFDPREMVFLQNDEKQFVTATNRTDAKVVKHRWSSHKIEAEVEASAPSLVVFSQAYYRPWKALAGGAPTKILRANYAFQAVQVPAGRHKVELVYKDTAFAIGTVISLSSLAAAVTGALMSYRRSKALPAHTVSASSATT